MPPQFRFENWPSHKSGNPSQSPSSRMPTNPSWGESQWYFPEWLQRSSLLAKSCLSFRSETAYAHTWVSYSQFGFALTRAIEYRVIYVLFPLLSGKYSHDRHHAWKCPDRLGSLGSKTCFLRVLRSRNSTAIHLSSKILKRFMKGVDFVVNFWVLARQTVFHRRKKWFPRRCSSWG